MSCWTNITGMIEISALFDDEKELEKRNIKYIEKVIYSYFDIPENLLEGSEGILLPKVLMHPMSNSIFISFRANLRHFGKRIVLDNKVTDKADFSEFSTWVKKTINNLKDIFEENYKLYDKYITYRYDLGIREPVIKTLQLKMQKEGITKELMEEYETKTLDYTIKMIDNEYNGECPVFMSLDNVLFHGFNSYGDTLKLNSMDGTLTILQNDILIETIKLKE